MAFTALDALPEGYEVYPVLDAIGCTSLGAYRAGLERVVCRGDEDAWPTQDRDQCDVAWPGDRPHRS